MPVSTYTSLLNGYADKAQTLRRQLGWLSLLRLLLFIGFIFCGYKAIATGHTAFILSAIALLIIFLLLIRLYDKWQHDTAFYKALVQLNRDEIDFLQGKPSVYADGREYTDPHHPYSYDLDLFGDGGLYSYLNRCSTGFGKEALAQSLLSPKTGDIAARQQAIAELKDKLRFRQHLQAHGSLLHTKEKEMRQLRAWLQAPSSFNNATLYKLLFLFPLASTAALIAYIITEQDNLLNAFYYLFILNLVVAFSFSRKITAHLSVSASVTKILQQFSGQLKQIEAEKFQSPLLLQYQQALQSGLLTASRSIARLASLFNYLETIVNLVVSMLLNGLFLFHVHILYALEKWKQQNGRLILPWLQVLGEMEALNSFANLAYNNPSFCTPALSPAPTLEAARMGHLLIRPEKRINNSISFSQQRFVILTGSNMSGKSTFLRTLGTSLVLARTGSVVCAERFVFYPFSVHVSMRITDSLQDSESFFYAELKRLRAIIEEIESGEQTFVILDEILRGTNSNDKHNGTVGLVQKLVAAKACGIIATHDLTVSALKEQRPDYISNKCFESEIINDELIFDYRLKDGVCEKLSASFLMKKMGIIS